MRKKIIKVIVFTTTALLVGALVIFVLLKSSIMPSSECKQAEAFLKTHMHHHGFIETTLVDNNGRRIEFSPYNYPSLYDALPVLDSIKRTCNVIIEQKKDSEEVSSGFLKKHILSSLELKEKSPFTKYISFPEFCEYVLPYRAGKEKFTDFMDSLRYRYLGVLKDAKCENDLLKATVAVNEDIRSWLEFDLRSHAEINDPGLPQIMQQKKGSCQSLTQFTLQALRSIGIPAAIDECPAWAHRNSGHQWNVVLDYDRRWVAFQGGEKNPDEFTAINDSVKAPKIYRHHFSAQNEIMFDTNDRDIPPIFLNSHLMSDVTNQYVSTSDVTVEVDSSLSGEDVLYLSVFNAEKWRIVARAPVINQRAVFENMSNNRIVYLPVLYKDHEIKPALDAFILSPSGIEKLTPNLCTLKKVELGFYKR